MSMIFPPNSVKPSNPQSIMQVRPKVNAKLSEQQNNTATNLFHINLVLYLTLQIHVSRTLHWVD